MQREEVVGQADLNLRKNQPDQEAEKPEEGQIPQDLEEQKFNQH